MSNVNRSTIKTRNTAVASGIDKHVASPVSIGNVTYAPAALKAVFTEHNAAMDASDVLYTQWRDRVTATRAAGDKADGTYLLLRHFLIGQYGNDAAAILNDFGMTAPKAKGPKTVAAKAEGIDKRRATRAARHTMGSVQRKVVTGESVAKATAAAAPSPVTPAPTPATAVSTPVSAGSTPVTPAPATGPSNTTGH
jgi:hypothetical protein